MKAAVKYYLISLVLLISLFLFLNYSLSQDYSNIGVISGRIRLARITAEQQTSNWAGIVGNLEGNLEETPHPIAKITITTSGIFEVSLPGENLKDSKHYFGILPINTTFNITKVRNVTESDLEKNGIFSETLFPIFYPDYYQKSDNPKATFCCQEKEIMVAGEWFKAFYITLKQNTEYYLLKYESEIGEVPLLLVLLKDYISYNGSICNYQFILPVDREYYIYIITKEPAYKLEIWIDNEKRTKFEQTALTYNLTVRVTNLYSGNPIPKINVIVFEENGNNIFIPKRLSGIISRAASVGKTDSNGYVTFIVAPTEYPTIEEYSIAVGILSENEIIRRINLTVENALSIERVKKYISPSNLLDNAKVTVNAMNQIINSLYKWANEVKKAYYYELYYFVNNNSYYFVNISDYKKYDSVTVKTGAPNLFRVYLKDANGNDVVGYVSPIEEEGYLLFNPTLNPPIIGKKYHFHEFLYVPAAKLFVITPTHYSDATSTIKLKILNEYKVPIANVSLEIDPYLEPREGGVSFSDDEMKVIINAMNSVVYSLYYSLN